MKEKNNTYVLVTVLVVIVLCVISYFYLNSRNKKIDDVTVLAQSKDTKYVENLEELLSKAKFVNDQKEEIIEDDFDESINVSVKIENETIAIRALGKSINVTSIENPVSVSTFFVGGEDDMKVDVYVLNEAKQLYHIATVGDKVKTIIFALPDIESYSTNVKMLDSREQAINYVVAKCTNGKYYTDYTFEDDKEYTLREITSKKIEEVEEKIDEDGTYGIYSTKEVDPFKDLDFNARVNSQNIDFDSKAITYKGWYYEEDEDGESSERTQTVVVNMKNVKQVALMCDETEGPCSKIYYLLTSGELYEINALEDGYFQKDEDGTYKKSTLLIDKKVTSFALIPTIEYNVETGDNQDVVYKKSDGKTYIGLMGKSYNADLYKRYWVDGTYFNPLFIVSKTAKVSNYLQTKDGKNLVAKKIFTFDGQEEDGDGDSFIFLYVLNEDDYLYEIDDYTKDKATKYSDKKVKSIKVRDEDILVTFADNSTDVIDAYLEYEAK